MRSRRPRGGARAPAAGPRSACALVLLCLSAACINLNTQRWPGPMEPEVDPLPPGDSNLHPIGPEEVSVIRHADPVRIRPAGTNSGRPLSFYDRQARMTAGGQVIVAPGGRAEVLWTEGSSVLLFGRAVAWIGSPSRGEPMFDLREVERAQLMLRGDDQVRLVGGALLSGEGGPYRLTRAEDDTLAVHNQSDGVATVAFREELFELNPGQQVVLPLLSAGGAPFQAPDAQRIPGPGFNVDVLGSVESQSSDGALLLRARESSEAAGLGVRVQLAPGAEATFSDLAVRAEEAAPAPRPTAAEAPGAPEAPEPPVPVSEGESGERVPADSGGG